MDELARIAFREGGLILPIRTPYDQETLFEYLEIYARQRRRLKADFAGATWIVAWAGSRDVSCILCRQSFTGVGYRRNGTLLCIRCARNVSFGLTSRRGLRAGDLTVAEQGGQDHGVLGRPRAALLRRGGRDAAQCARAPARPRSRTRRT